MAVLRRTIGPAILAIGAVLLPARRVEAQVTDRAAEYEVKSAYLFNLLQFVTWPASGPAPDEAIRLCVFGDDPMGDLLSRAVGNRTAGGRPVTLVAVSRVVEADRCHAAFIAARNAIPWRRWLAAVRGKPIFTVGEGAEFARNGGMVALVVDGETVRFEVNTRALRETGLQLSSRVLRLAVNTYDR